MDIDRRPGTPGLETKVFIAPGITSRVSFTVRILMLLQFHEGDTEYTRVTPMQQVCVTAEETSLFYNLLSSCKFFQPLSWGKYYLYYTGQQTSFPSIPERHTISIFQSYLLHDHS